MEEILTSLIIFWYKSLKTVLYQIETDIFSFLSTVFFRKTSRWSITNSCNQLKQELMLWLDAKILVFVEDLI